MQPEQIARVAHEVNRAYCQALGDSSQAPWEEAPQWQRDSAISGVRFHIENPHAGPEASHEAWLQEKLVAGWKWGAVKDAEKKEHPCVMSYDALPVEQRAKDFLFRAVVHAITSGVHEAFADIADDLREIVASDPGPRRRHAVMAEALAMLLEGQR
jgi:hypothetical protein